MYFCTVASILNFLHQYLGPDLKVAGFIILNLIVIEGLLSVDNAAVLARLVMDLPTGQRKAALRIGILLAYLFRGTCLIFAGVLIRISWLKLLGGLYLLYLFFDFFFKKFKHHTVAGEQHIPKSKFHFLSPFLSTVLMVELMDLSFSIDNVFAAVAFTDNIILVCIGVFIGIIMMRIVAGYFVLLMERFPFMDTIALVVIGLLGMKLCVSFAAPYIGSDIQVHIDDRKANLYFSLLTVSIFVLPVLGSLIFDSLSKKA
jgi:YkoY family integral membrane protein